MIQTGNGISGSNVPIDGSWGGAEKGPRFVRPSGFFTGVPRTGETEVYGEEGDPSAQIHKMRPAPIPSEAARQRRQGCSTLST